ncbi:MAG: hypothetical protein KGI84_00810 [Elusimicrobia bacterium]|nr:hypothetical protein [Elusimicrobiota bacterium]
MNSKILWIVIAILSLACAGEGYYIHAELSPQPAQAAQAAPQATPADEAAAPAAPPQNPWSALAQWQSQALKNLSAGNPIPPQSFDNLFNDGFFQGQMDPFAEIRDFEKRMAPFFSARQQPLFKRSWRSWFNDRIDLADIEPSVKTTQKQVIVSFKVPGLQKGSLNVSVNGSRIKLSYSAKTTRSRKNAQGEFQSESVRQFEKIIPVPSDAVPGTSRITRSGDTLKIVFSRRKGGASVPRAD